MKSDDGHTSVILTAFMQMEFSVTRNTITPKHHLKQLQFTFKEVSRPSSEIEKALNEHKEKPEFWSQYSKLSMMGHTCNPSIQKVEAGGSGVQGHT